MIRRCLIPINPEHMIAYNNRMDNTRVPVPDGENICCEHVKNIGFLTVPFLGIQHLNVNYCFVCGRKLDRG